MRLAVPIPVAIGSCKYEHLSTFSFHPVKTITTGEGGAVTTNSKTSFHCEINGPQYD